VALAAAGGLLFFCTWWLTRSPEPPSLEEIRRITPLVAKPRQPSKEATEKERQRIQEKIRALEAAVDQLSVMIGRAEFDFRSMADSARYPEEAEEFHRWAEGWKDEINRFSMPPEPEKGDPETFRTAHRKFKRALFELTKLANPFYANRYGFPNEVERNGRLFMAKSRVELAQEALENAKRR
jgi:hypothetical protein